MNTKYQQVEVVPRETILQKQFEDIVGKIATKYNPMAVEDFDRRGRSPSTRSAYFIFEQEETAKQFRRELQENPKTINCVWIREVE